LLRENKSLRDRRERGENGRWEAHTPFVSTVITSIAIGILEEKGPEEGRSTEGVTPGTPEPPVSTHIFNLQRAK
jgi:hypothetical protein